MPEEKLLRAARLRYDEWLDPGGTPDLFTVAILDNMGIELPTTGAGDEFLDISLTGGSSPTVSTIGSAPGSAFALSAPTVRSASPVPVPEPTSIALLGAALLFTASRQLPARGGRERFLQLAAKTRTA